MDTGEPPRISLPMNALVNQISEERIKHIEAYIRLYLEGANLSIEDIVMTEQHSDDGRTIYWRCLPRKEVEK